MSGLQETRTQTTHRVKEVCVGAEQRWNSRSKPQKLCLKQAIHLNRSFNLRVWTQKSVAKIWNDKRCALEPQIPAGGCNRLHVIQRPYVDQLQLEVAPTRLQTLQWAILSKSAG